MLVLIIHFLVDLVIVDLLNMYHQWHLYMLILIISVTFISIHIYIIDVIYTSWLNNKLKIILSGDKNNNNLEIIVVALDMDKQPK